ncbi:MAG: hypothetical protein IPI55_18490 [Flavobacteriales bacterium]|nr:hypothetical protein [Flavobacteriales bacterium]
MANDEVSRTGEGLRKRLDKAEVLLETVHQLRKDLGEETIGLPPVGDAAFECLRTDVKRQLDDWQRRGSIQLSRAINRVDLTELMVDDAMTRGGLHELAGSMVLRCLQKVLLRKRFAGLG